ncbi:hypothetical protein [Filimonas effusa]|uniref:Uncharacterized protein n=1 Tax=Filimonas effusa TaxID=2508721 RepID=A0A4Q1DC75_9BACT|nr:hypothetical protein [Filimonas effusa]RXK86548.1 hypothetical protein ESB13_07005 [Filimonas effusa]
MYVLLNQGRETVAYIETNMIVEAGQTGLIGVMLGNCLFDKSGRLAGKFFGGKVYNLKGEQIADAIIADSAADISFQRHLEEASDIAYSIADHADVWIEPTGKWSREKLTELLAVREKAFARV